ncbi:MAG: zinc ribbon domain-containing protein [Armatimonadetes bacterium]|nr:zinc ribbon domain-containing protein [Armatimonadota bacterium]
MPLYEYECSKCGRRFELLRPRSEARQPAQCPFCGSKKTRRVLSPARIGGRGGLFEDVSISERDIPKPLKDTFPPGWREKLGKHLS